MSVNDLNRRVVEHRMNLHQRAEVGFNLIKTQNYIIEQISKFGFAPEIIGRGSIIAVEEGYQQYILLRADMDALPITEETNLPYKSINGCMHACGHDMHSAMLLTAAEAIKAEERKRKHGVIFLFQAAEETLQGARDVLESAKLEKYNITFAVTIHVILGLPYKPGTLIIPPCGIVAPGADVINIEFKGKSSHGSTPHLGKSSIYPAIDTIEQTNRMLSLDFSPLEIRNINWGYIHGGVESNIVAETTEIRGNFRYYDTSVRAKAIKRLKEIVNASCSVSECTSKFEIIGGCPPLLNSQDLLSCIENILKLCEFEYILSDDIKKEKNDKKLGGSEDFAHFSEIYPSALISICAGNEKTGQTFGLHTSKTDFHSKALESGWRFFYSLALYL